MSGTAADILLKASELVSGDRDRQHGAKARNFQNIANVWNALLGDQITRPITASQVGVLMAGLKLARTMSGALNVDDAIDCAGYVACFAEIAQGDQP
ncbi:MAG: DUF6378 domain-containing protein [Elsteraceae bacterium]